MLQRTAYLVVIFVLFPLIIWTGLAMSPSFTAAFPGRRSCWEGGNRRAPCTSSFLVAAAVPARARGDGGGVGIPAAACGP